MNGAPPAGFWSVVSPESFPYWLLFIKPAALALCSLLAGAGLLATLAAARSPRSALARVAIAGGALALTAVDLVLSLGGIVSDSLARAALTADLLAIVFGFVIAVAIVVVNLRARSFASPAALFAFGSIAALVVGAVVRVFSSESVDLHEQGSYFVVYHTDGPRLATIFVLLAGAYQLGLGRRISEGMVRFGRWHFPVMVAASAAILVNPRILPWLGLERRIAFYDPAYLRWEALVACASVVLLVTTCVAAGMFARASVRRSNADAAL